LRKWGVNGRKMFLYDKKQFENSMEKFIGCKLKIDKLEKNGKK
jgi:hypothetical protein